MRSIRAKSSARSRAVRLRDLDAQWICDADEAKRSYRRRSDGTIAGAQGVLFQCPLCGAGLEPGEENGRRFLRGAHYILVCFSNPVMTNVAPDTTAGGAPRWRIESGSTLDDLTLSPSINCDIPWKDKDGVEHPSSCRFHGYIRNGEVA